MCSRYVLHIALLLILVTRAAELRLTGLDLHSRAIVCRVWVGRARADASRIRYETSLLHDLRHNGNGNDLVIRHNADRAGDRARAATAA